MVTLKDLSLQNLVNCLENNASYLVFSNNIDLQQTMKSKFDGNYLEEQNGDDEIVEGKSLREVSVVKAEEEECEG